MVKTAGTLDAAIAGHVPSKERARAADCIAFVPAQTDWAAHRLLYVCRFRSLRRRFQRARWPCGAAGSEVPAPAACTGVVRGESCAAPEWGKFLRPGSAVAWVRCVPSRPFRKLRRGSIGAFPTLTHCLTKPWGLGRGSTAASCAQRRCVDPERGTVLAPPTGVGSGERCIHQSPDTGNR